jgi:hypothetical protein
MPVERIEKTFTYKIPNEWRTDDFSQGKTGTFTYKGPRYLTFEIDKNTKEEAGWCLWEDRDLERPCALDCVRVTVDCSLNDENALLCEIANDCGDPEQVKFRNERTWTVKYQPPEGYEPILITDQYEPRDIYDEYGITYDFENGKFNIPIKTLETDGWDISITWDDVKEVRDKMLKDSDGKISDDMPEEIQQQWRTYRQLLRDLPDALKEFPPYIAGHMFPKSPD